jgi:hypothetical protein
MLLGIAHDIRHGSLLPARVVYGSIWKQRYFTKIGNDYYPEPVTWDVTHQVFRRYFVENNTDWWTKFYPPDNMKRPTGALCDGCHSVNYNIQTKTVTEWNVGCERCHGPGIDHAARPSRDTIVNPVRLNSYAANDVCIQCHSQGQPLQKPLNGVYYDWPVGFEVGKNLRDFLATRRAQAGRDDVHPFRRRRRAQEPDARQRFRAECDVHARRHLLFLPRRSRYGQQCATAKTGQRDVPGVPRP